MSQLFQPSEDTEPKEPAQAVTLLAIAVTFLRLGATTFGGMWAATRQLELELVERRGWLKQSEMPLFLVAATVIPSPKFLGLGGIIGFKLRGLAGSTVAVVCLIIPGALMVLIAVLLIPPALLAGKLAPMQRTVGLVVAGILFGSAGRQVRTAGATGLLRIRGIGVALAIGLAMAAGVPLILAVAVGFALGVVLIKES